MSSHSPIMKWQLMYQMMLEAGMFSLSSPKQILYNFHTLLLYGHSPQSNPKRGTKWAAINTLLQCVQGGRLGGRDREAPPYPRSPAIAQLFSASTPPDLPKSNLIPQQRTSSVHANRGKNGGKVEEFCPPAQLLWRWRALLGTLFSGTRQLQSRSAVLFRDSVAAGDALNGYLVHSCQGVHLDSMFFTNQRLLEISWASLSFTLQILHNFIVFLYFFV